MDISDYFLTNIYEQLCCGSIILGIVVVFVYWATNKLEKARWSSVTDVATLRKKFEPRARPIIQKHFHEVFPNFVRKAPKCSCGYQAPQHPKGKPLTRMQFEAFFTESGNLWERVTIGQRVQSEEYYVERDVSSRYPVYQSVLGGSRDRRSWLYVKSAPRWFRPDKHYGILGYSQPLYAEKDVPEVGTVSSNIVENEGTEVVIEERQSEMYIVCPKCHRMLLNFTQAMRKVPKSRLYTPTTGIWWHDAGQLVRQYWSDLDNLWTKLNLPSLTSNSRDIVMLIERDLS